MHIVQHLGIAANTAWVQNAGVIHPHHRSLHQWSMSIHSPSSLRCDMGSHADQRPPALGPFVMTQSSLWNGWPIISRFSPDRRPPETHATKILSSILLLAFTGQGSLTSKTAPLKNHETQQSLINTLISPNTNLYMRFFSCWSSYACIVIVQRERRGEVMSAVDVTRASTFLTDQGPPKCSQSTLSKCKVLIWPLVIL